MGEVSCGGKRKGERKGGELYYYLNQVSAKISLRAILKTVHPKCSQVIKKFIFFLIMNFFKELQKKNVCWFFSLCIGVGSKAKTSQSAQTCVSL